MLRSPKSSLAPLAICLALTALVALTFGQAAWFDFTTYDDPGWLTANPQVQAGLSWAGLSYAFTTPILGHWAPLTILSHMAACQFLGSAPGPHHLVNLALHAAGSIALFLALRSLTGAFWRSAAVAALFAVHPMRTESVLWITERKDVLCGLFFFLTLWAYAAWTRRRTFLRYALVLLLFAGALMAKSMALTLPFVLLLLDSWPLGRVNTWGEWRRRVVEKIPLFALSIGMALLQYSLVHQGGNGLPVAAALTLLPADGHDWISRISNAAVSYGIYLRQLFWPGSLSVFYPHPLRPNDRPDGWFLALSVAVLLGLTAYFRHHRTGHRYLWIGWLWFLGMLVPVIGIVQAGEIARADRYTYLPHVGLLLLVVWGAAEMVFRLRLRPVFPTVAAALALTTAVLATRAQSVYWRNDETLWTHALAVTVNNHHAHDSLGVLEAQRQNYPAAAAHFLEAIRIAPTYWPAYAGLAHARLHLGDARGAMEAAERAVQLHPGEPRLRVSLLTARQAYAGPLHAQAESLLHEGRFVEAIEAHDRAMHYDPSALPATTFALLLASAGQYPTAETALREALAIDPTSELAALNLANVREKRGALADAASIYQSVLDRHPHQLNALAGLAQVLTREGRLNDALPLIDQALALQPNDGNALYTLGTIRILQGQPAEAVKLYHRAIDAQPDLAEAQVNLAWILATSNDDTLRNGAEAVRWAQSACRGPAAQNPAMLRILAAAHAEAGSFPEAVATIDRALRLAQSLGDIDLLARLNQQRALYEKGQPLRVPIR